MPQLTDEQLSKLIEAYDIVKTIKAEYKATFAEGENYDRIYHCLYDAEEFLLNLANPYNPETDSTPLDLD